MAGDRRRERLIVCLTGMPGSGKTTVAEAARRLGFHLVSMGDAVREEAKRRNLEPGEDVLGRLAVELREEGGKDAVARLVSAIIPDDTNRILVDGVRSRAELEHFRRTGRVRVLAVHASPEDRLSFVSRRGRRDDSDEQQTLSRRDERELSLGIGEVIVTADGMVLNGKGMRMEDLRRRGLEIIRRWVNEHDKS